MIPTTNEAFRKSISGPWVVDADSIKTLEIQKYIHKTIAIDHFLNYDNIFFVIGSKGVGKTLLLKTKRQKYYETHKHKEMEDVLIIPFNLELDIPRFNFVFDPSLLEFLRSSRNWEYLWILSILSSILYSHIHRIDTEDVRKDIEKKIGNSQIPLLNIMFSGNRRYPAKTPSEFLQGYISIISRESLDNPQELKRLTQDIFDAIMLLSEIVMNMVRYGCAVFIDRVDEAIFEKFEEINLPKNYEWIIPEIWKAVQVGLIHAVDYITTRSHHIKIYISIRKEVWESLKTSLFQQFQGKSIELEYTVKDLRSIFIKNIDLIDNDKKLASPKSRDPIEKFIGFQEIQNLYTGKKEEIFMYLYRHTFHRPRDVVQMGLEIYKVEPECRTPENIRKIVNETAANILSKQYIPQITPYANIDFDELFRFINTNILNKKKIERIFSKYRRKTGDNSTDEELLSKLYNFGLIGTVSRDSATNKLIQKFLSPHEMHIASGISLIHNAEVFFIHPALDAYLHHSNPRYSACRLVTIGNTYPIDQKKVRLCSKRKKEKKPDQDSKQSDPITELEIFFK